MNQANIQYLPQWKALGNSGDLPVGWTPSSGGSSSGGSSAAAAPDFSAIAAQAQKMAQDAAAPAISTLQGQIPQIQSIYAGQQQRAEAQRQPLLDRYQNLLDQIKGNQTIAENRTTTATNNELGLRGISGDSTLAQQTIANAVNPVTQQYTGLAKDTGIAQQQDINSLNSLEGTIGDNQANALMGVQNTIAQLQAGSGSSAAGNALALYNAQNQAQQGQQSLNIQQQAQNLNQEQSRYISIPGVGVFDKTTGGLVGGISTGGLSTGGYSILGIQ